MRARRQPERAHRFWVASVAEHINDPLLRLRFLKAAAPPFASHRSRRILRVLIPSLGVAAVLLAVLLLAAATRLPPLSLPPAALKPKSANPAIIGTPSPVWLVERSGTSETYSNGLRIDNRYVVSNHARSYLAFPKDVSQSAGPVQRSNPVGIVFHSSESQQFPFEASENGLLKRTGESLLEYVRRRRAYHFVVDRFGRVFRLVNETDAADHCGYSVWADDRWVYLELNESFLGVAFEAQTQAAQAEASLNPGQLRSGSMLVEMLRSRYSIPESNCVTHAQVSVNPDNMRLGYHTDWASGFPFEKLELPANYELLLPSVVEFGFEADPAFLEAAAPQLRDAAARSEEQLRHRAAAAQVKMPPYVKALRKRYHGLLAESR